MKKKTYITPWIQVNIIDSEELLDIAPQSQGVVNPPPGSAGDDVNIDIDNSGTVPGWDDTDETL